VTPPTTPAGALARRRLSLRARLLVAFLVPTLLVLAVVAFASTAVVRHQLMQQVDDRLAGAGSRSEQAAGDYGSGDRPGPAAGDRGPAGGYFGPGQGEGTLVARFTDGVCVYSAVIERSGDLSSLTDEQVDALSEVGVGSSPASVDVGGDLGSYRVVSATTPDGDLVVTGLPLDSVDDAVGSLIIVEVVAGLIALLVAALAAAVVIRRTLRPLDRVATTATRVSELELSTGEVQLAERVPPEDTDTRTEVGQVGTALNRLLDHVEGSLSARQLSETQVRQFVADASHELRTPLASIRGYAELVRRQHSDVAPEVGHALRRVESEAVRMSVLVEDLLLLARLDAGRDLVTEEVDLAALVVDTVSDAHVAGPQHRWRVDLPGVGVVVPGDGLRLHQVLANLLVNARTHTPAGTTVVTRLRTEGGWAVLEVADDGPGIPPGLLAQVFERFARGDSSRSRQAGSTGLGLAIVHAVVTAHHGTVTVASEPGRTVFTVRLPHAESMTADAGSDDAVTDDS
jgi:two-component system OmpR family sensor kinase